MEDSTSRISIEAMHFRYPPGGKGFALFVLLGPPIGGATLYLWLIARAAIVGRLAFDHSGILLADFVINSYWLGIFPAAITGVIAGILKEEGRLSSVRQCLYIGVLGGAMSALFPTLLFIFQERWHPSWTKLSFTIANGFGPVFLPGFVAALCCAIMFRNRIKPDSQPSRG